MRQISDYITYRSIQALSLAACCLLGAACGTTQTVRTVTVQPSQSTNNDLSRAGTDGPHVFYKGTQTIVLSVAMDGNEAEARKQVFRSKQDAVLTCQIPESNESFSFPLKDSIGLEQDYYPTLPERVLVLSDIEGNFNALKTMLRGAGVINAQYNWTYGNGHLVLLGDFVDRGLEVTQCLWLIYKLEVEAAKNGGAVHFVLGNHEIMTLSGDQRYVRNKYFENAELIGETYHDWFSNAAELGRWLRSKNAVLQMGDYVFCHGSLSTNLAQTRLELSDINRIARRFYGIPLASITDVEGQAIFNDRNGIFWYRTIAKNLLPTAEVNSILDRYKVKRMVVGHTLQTDVNLYYHGRVICTDLYHEENIRAGLMKTLIIESGTPYNLNSRGEKMPLTVIPTVAKSSPNEE
jgi:hypothetical protein